MDPKFNREWEQAIEAKFARDEEQRFLIAARRDKLFATWAAARMHLSEAETDALIQALLKVPDGKGHDEALLRLVAHTLTEHGVRVSDAEMMTVLADCATQAAAM